MPESFSYLHIAAMGKYLPECVVTNSELECELGLRDGWIEKATGVRERRRAKSGTSTAAMAAAAALQALERAGLTVNDIDLIVGASSGPEQLIPCTAALVQRELGAPEGKSTCFDVSATCLSFPMALQLIAPLLSSGIYKTVLLFSSEMTAHSLNSLEPESAALMGDAAVAAILIATPTGSESRLHHCAFETYATRGVDLTRFLGGGSRHHPNDELTTKEMNQFEMRGPQIFRLASEIFPPFLNRFLANADCSPDFIDVIVPHQASGKGITGVAARCDLPLDKFVINLPIRGNCIAASIPLALCEAWEDGFVRRGQRVLLVGTGAGLTLGAVLLTL